MRNIKNKKCNMCREVLSVEKFYKLTFIKKDGTKSKTIAWCCKDCNKKRGEKWRKENPRKVKAIDRKKYLKDEFNMTSAEYDNLLSSQNYCCKICGVHKDNVKNHLSVDHCHKTGKIRGLLCIKCNSGIGFFNEDKGIINKAIKYLEEYETNNN